MCISGANRKSWCSKGLAARVAKGAFPHQFPQLCGRGPGRGRMLSSVVCDLWSTSAKHHIWAGNMLGDHGSPMASETRSPESNKLVRGVLLMWGTRHCPEPTPHSSAPQPLSPSPLNPSALRSSRAVQRAKLKLFTLLVKIIHQPEGPPHPSHRSRGPSCHYRQLRPRPGQRSLSANEGRGCHVTSAHFMA